MSLECEYWCRYHGRYEHTEDEEACRTFEQIKAEMERQRYRRSDPPAFGVRVLRFFGVQVQP